MIHINSTVHRNNIASIQRRNAECADKYVKAVAPKCTRYCGKNLHRNCPLRKEMRA